MCACEWLRLIACARARCAGWRDERREKKRVIACVRAQCGRQEAGSNERREKQKREQGASVLLLRVCVRCDDSQHLLRLAASAVAFYFGETGTWPISCLTPVAVCCAHDVAADSRRCVSQLASNAYRYVNAAATEPSINLEWGQQRWCELLREQCDKQHGVPASAFPDNDARSRG